MGAVQYVGHSLCTDPFWKSKFLNIQTINGVNRTLRIEEIVPVGIPNGVLN